MFFNFQFEWDHIYPNYGCYKHTLITGSDENSDVPRLQRPSYRTVRIYIVFFRWLNEAEANENV